jgi:PmbA protein
MIKDQDFLKAKASYCLDLAKKIGATDASVTIGHSFLKLLILEIKN